MKKWKRALAFALSLLMLGTSIDMSAFETRASGTQTTVSGNVAPKEQDERTESKDWSSESCVQYAIADVQNHEDYTTNMKLDIWFSGIAEEEKVLSGDTLQFYVPSDIYTLADTEEGSSISAYAGDAALAGTKDAALGNDVLATYTIKNSVVTLTFTDYIEQAEDVSALFARLELAMAYNQDVLTSEVQETTWSIQNYTDGTSYDLTIELPAMEKEKEDVLPTGYDNTTKETELTSLQKAIREELLGKDDTTTQTTFEGLSPAMTQDVYIVDNNMAGLSEKDVLEAFLSEGAFTATYTEGGETIQIPANLVGGAALAADLGGTGHYILKLNAGALPTTVTVTDVNGNEKQIPLEWSFTATKDFSKFTEEYYYTDVNDSNKEDITNNTDVQNGWYFLKTYDFITDIVIRDGDNALKSYYDNKAIIDKISEKFSYYWYEYGTKLNEEPKHISVAALLGITDKSNFRSNASFKLEYQGDGKYQLEILNIPQYRVDGTENLSYVQADIDYIDAVAGDDNQLKITYENSETTNHGDKTDAVYDKGTVYLTLSGETVYTATKAWADHANDVAKRPGLNFSLWRYTKKPDSSYKTASPVKNNKGKILQFNVDAGSTVSGNKISIQFDTTNQIDLDGVFLGEGEELPKYDPEGYEYVYFVREEMDETTVYTQVFGSISYIDGKIQVTDTLPNGMTARADGDGSVYNGGTISNVFTDTVTTKVQKIWDASSFQHSVDDMVAEFTLQSRRKTDDSLTEFSDVLDDSGNPITCVMKNFMSESMTEQYSKVMPKYDLQGYELEYQWIETGVYKEEKNAEGTTVSSPNLLEGGKFAVTKDGVTFHFESISTASGNNLTVVTNKIENEIDYKVDKIWKTTDGKAPDGAKITLTLVRQLSGQNVPLTYKQYGKVVTPTFALDGEVDEDVQTYEVEGNTVTFQEISPWQVEFNDLPKYDANGKQYEYIVFETNGVAGYQPLHSTEYKEDCYYTQIVNKPTGEEMNIYVRKVWLDDSDVDHRGNVTVTAYERIAYERYEPLTLSGSNLPCAATLTESGFWWDEIEIPMETETEDVVVVETKIGNRAISYTNEDLEKIWKGIHNGESTEPFYFQKYEGDAHWYNQMYSIDNVENTEFFTVTNQRTGIINLTVTKNWIDGDKTARTKLQNTLSSNDLQIRFKLSLLEEDTAEGKSINRTNDTINLGASYAKTDGKDGNVTKDVPIMKPGNNSQGDQLVRADDNQILKFDLNAASQNVYFYNLPKYDANGAVVHYTVEEIITNSDGDQVSNENNEAMSWGDVARKLGFDYSSVLVWDDYEVGPKHTNDKQNAVVTNRLEGKKDITYYKEWLDDYRVTLGERPDIYLDVYQYKHVKDAAEKSLVSYYKEYKWVRTPDMVDRDHWTVTLRNLPKYDEQGYEIFYYAKEGMNIEGSAFDYRDVYFENENENPDVALGTQSKGPITNSQGDISEENLEWMKLLDSENVWLLKESGTFVNQLENEIRINGKKLWGNVPSGYMDAELPPITFYVYQYLTEIQADGTEKLVMVKDGSAVDDPVQNKENAVAWIDVTEWNGVKQNGIYAFYMDYLGKNINTYKTDEKGERVLSVTGEEGAKKIPLYSEKGERYTYVMSEVIHMPSDETDWTDVYRQAYVNGYLVQNFYESEKGDLVVGKLFDQTYLKYDANEQYPKITFELERYYNVTTVDENNVSQPTAVRDTSFSRTVSIEPEELKGWYSTEENRKTALTKTISGLNIYAPNGEKYDYRVREVLSEEINGYSVQVKTGDDTYTKIEPGTGYSFKLEAKGKKQAEESGKAQTVVTFENFYNPGEIELRGGKQWQDMDNLTGVRPEMFETNENQVTLSGNNLSAAKLELKVSRYAKAQTGESNGIGTAANPIPVKPYAVDEYTVTWKRKDDTSNNWTYTINGLDKYAPNGMPWIYIVEEKLKEPYATLYEENVSKATGEPKEETSGENVTEYIQVKDFENILKTSASGQKAWSYAPINAQTDNHDYANNWKLEVEFTLQARVDKAINSEGQEISGAGKEWMDADDFFATFLDKSGGNESGTYGQVMKKIGNVQQSKIGKMTDASPWNTNFTYGNLTTGIETEKEADNIGVNSFISIKYRVVESKITYYQGSSKLYEQTISVEPLTGADLDKIEYAAGENSPFIITQNGTLVTNTLDTTELRVIKKWEGDHNDIYDSRPLTNDKQKWKTDFVVERRAKGSNDAWEVAKMFTADAIDSSEGNAVILTRLESSNTEGDAWSITGLPKYGLRVKTSSNSEGNVAQYELFEYEYRARELQPGKNGPGVNNENIVDHNGTFYNTYQVYYGTASNIGSGADTTDKKDGNSTMNALTLNDIYYTLVTNELINPDEFETDFYAEKRWAEIETLSDNSIKKALTAGMSDVKLELQYLKEGTEGEKPTWESFENPAIVNLNGISDDKETHVDTSKVAYYENESWKAVWRNVPKIVPGSVTEMIDTGKVDAEGNKIKVEQTIYRVKEHDGESFYMLENSGTIEASEPSVTDEKILTNIPGRTESKPYMFSNTPTKLEIKKSVGYFGSQGENFSLNKTFTFTVTANNNVNGTYVAVRTKADGTAVTENITFSDAANNAATVVLNDGDSIVIYGLPHHKINGTSETAVTYTVKETTDGSFTTETVKIIYPKSTVEATNTGGTESTSTTLTDASGNPYVEITFPDRTDVDDKDDAAKGTEFQNKLHGTIHITKVDESGNAISGAQFKIQYKVTSSNAAGEEVVTTKALDEEVCTDEALITAGGIAISGTDGKLKFNELKLGVTYVITEISVPGGHNKLIESFDVVLPYTVAGTPDENSDIKPVGTVGTGGNNHVYFAVRYKVGNNSALDVPTTGGNPILWTGIAGAALMGLGAIFWCVTGERKKRKDFPTA